MEYSTCLMPSTHKSPHALAIHLYCKDLVRHGIELRTCLMRSSTHQSSHALANILYCKDLVQQGMEFRTPVPYVVPISPHLHSLMIFIVRTWSSRAWDSEPLSQRSTYKSPPAIANNLYRKDLVQPGIELRTPVPYVVPTSTHLHLLIISIVRTWSSRRWISGPLAHV